MEGLVAMIYVRYMILRERFVEGVHDFLADEQGDVNIVSIVVLIGIVVLVAMLFRDRIELLVGNLFDIIEGTSGEAISN